MNTNKVALDFSGYSDPEFDTFSGKVLTGLTKNQAFPNPPVSIADLTKLVTGFHTALLASLQGGLQLTAAKNSAREALDLALRQEAHYVEAMASRNLETLLSSGFFAVTTAGRRTTGPLPKPLVTLVDMGQACLRVKLGRVPNAKSYQVQYSTNGNGAEGWKDAGIYTRTRDITLDQLVPGTVYNVRVKAFGGSTGNSDWSDPVAKMATGS